MGETTETGQGWRPNPRTPQAHFPVLVLAWCLAEPERAGDLAILDDHRKAFVLGRGGAQPDDPHPRLGWYRHRPGHLEPRPPLGALALSRRQLLVRPQPDGTVAIERLGKLPLYVCGQPRDTAVLSVGDTARLGHELLLLCAERAPASLRVRTPPPTFAFGEPDAQGLVGESPELWRLRDEIAFYAQREHHVLVLGPSGTGKELVARALHSLSPRSGAPFVARNAATLPEGLIDAELFGNAKNYPNAGMPERPGLVGEAQGGTLFLDEIGEIPEELQARLLRLLDGGDYHRLGEATARRANVRLVGATNRGESAIKHDLLARLKLRLDVPGLDARREDIPLLIRFLLRTMRERDPALLARLTERTPSGEPCVDPALVDALLRHGYATHIRELEALLLLAITKGRDPLLALCPEVQGRLALTTASASLPPPPLDADAVRAALDRCGGNVSRAARELGLSDRNALYRLMKKLGVEVQR